SGYSDMAIAIAQAFDIRLPENFNMPYAARNIAEYWRRWHMTLTRWLRDYVYIPLGGNRLGAARTDRNIILTFAIVGLWHGAAGHVCMGRAPPGVLVSFSRASPRPRRPGRRPAPLATAAPYLSACGESAFSQTPPLAAGGVMLRRGVTPTAGLSLQQGDPTI